MRDGLDEAVPRVARQKSHRRVAHQSRGRRETGNTMGCPVSTPRNILSTLFSSAFLSLTDVVTMVLNKPPSTPRPTLQAPSSSNDVSAAPGADDSGSRIAADMQQLIREVFADVKDIEDFYNIKFSRSRVRAPQDLVSRLPLILTSTDQPPGRVSRIASQPACDELTRTMGAIRLRGENRLAPSLEMGPA